MLFNDAVLAVGITDPQALNEMYCSGNFDKTPLPDFALDSELPLARLIGSSLVFQAGEKGRYRAILD